MSEDFRTIIGLEIHVQLKTESKMFCRCPNEQIVVHADSKDLSSKTNTKSITVNQQPNVNICPVCMGMPGTLPVPNCKAIEMTVRLGLALESKIAKISKFDRKHYFYPDLPKGYQISQYDQPFCEGGQVVVGGKVVRLNRIHLEEDAGKLIHTKVSGHSKVDLNRAGTPLAEIVTEPDIESPKQAGEFLKELQLILRRLDISDADMERGHLRSDANINVISNGKSSPIVEIKNLNSFKFIVQALLYEQKRLIDKFDSFDGKKTKQTRGFDSDRGTTYALRQKEDAKDYRYFPEPDIPPFQVRDFIDIERMRSELEDLPSTLRTELAKSNVASGDIEIIIRNKEMFSTIRPFLDKDPVRTKIASNLVVNEKGFLKLGHEFRKDLVDLIIKEDLSSNIIRTLVSKSISSGSKPSDIFSSPSDVDDIGAVVDEVIAENEQACEKIKNGQSEVLKYLTGQVMKKTNGRCDPREATKILIERIRNGR